MAEELLLQDFNSQPRARKAFTPVHAAVISHLWLALILLGGSIAAGLAMVGTPFLPYTNPNAGVLTTINFFGMIILMFATPLGFMLVLRVLPDLFLLDRKSVAPVDFDTSVGRSRPFPVARLVLFFILLGSIVGMVTSMHYLIQPDQTFVVLEGVIGANDAQVVAIGGFLFAGAAIVGIAALGLLFHEQITMLPLRTIRLSDRVWNMIKVFFFVALYAILLAFVSSFAPSPTGSGAVTAGNYFASTSEFSLVNIQHGPNFVYKLYTDVVVFYVVILGLALLGVLATQIPSVARLLYYRVYVPSDRPRSRVVQWLNPFPHGLHFGELIVILSFIGLFIYWVYFWRVTFSYLPDAASHHVHADTEIAARVLGQIVNLCSSLLLAPASRTGLWVAVFGIPYERALAYHRFLGGITYIILTLHTIVWWAKWGAEGNLNNNIIAINTLYANPTFQTDSDWTIPAAELAYLLLTFTVIGALVARRRVYAVFQATHKYIGLVYFVVAIFHAWSFWQTAIGGLLLWVVDKWCSVLAAAPLITPHTLEWDEITGVTTVRALRPAGLRVKAGQYFFLNIPEISLHTWHPFTASACLQGELVFHIKNQAQGQTHKTLLRPGAWTSALSSLATDLYSRDIAMPVLRLRGPFGDIPYQNYERLLLFAGGIGITPMMSILVEHLRAARANPRGGATPVKVAGLGSDGDDDEMVRAGRAGSMTSTKRPRITLVWLAPSAALFTLFSDVFEAIRQHQSSRPEPDHQFSVALHATRAGTMPDNLHVGGGVELKQGRANIAEVFAQYSRTGRRSLACVCGPTPLINQVSAQAKLFDCDFHTELFEF
eukprot:m.64117 g.64117  ORF g.64117 m.64117 type:complete len:828 (-) comp12505_c1_seq2:67-2550(-)